MANSKISALTSATTPLAGTETLPIVQSSTTKQVSVANLTAGRAVSAASLALTTSPLPATSGGTGSSSAFINKGVAYATSTTALTTASDFTYDGTNFTVATATAQNASGGRGNITLAGSSSAIFNLSVASANSGSIYHTGTEMWFHNRANGPALFFTNDTERVRISAIGDMTVNTGNFIVGTSGNGLTSTGTITCKSSSGGGNWQVFSSASSTNPAYFINGSGTVNGIATGANAAAAAMYVNKDSGSTRSINAAGTVNAAGLDYAEYMVKDGNFVIDKGDICGVKSNGKLTNVFAEAISFVVKSTSPSYVGGDTWFNEEAPQPPIELTALDENSTDEQKAKYEIDLTQYQSNFAIYNADLASWKQRMETERSKVDRIAFCGQVPVNVQGATPGQFIIPVDDNGAIKGQAISNPTFEQYQSAIGKVIAIEADGRAKIIVKIS